MAHTETELEQEEVREETEQKTEAQGETSTDDGTDVEEKKQEEDFKAKYYYLAAEFDNTRKRFERERSQLLKYGNEKVLSDLLDVVDNLDRTISASEVAAEEDPKIKNILTGVDMVRKQFLEVLSLHGLTPVESVGEIFDPNFHEAMAKRPAEEGVKDEEILEEYQKGYSLNGRLLRASKVVVASKE